MGYQAWGSLSSWAAKPPVPALYIVSIGLWFNHRAPTQVLIEHEVLVELPVTKWVKSL